jgi:hypothetical protein
MITVKRDEMVARIMAGIAQFFAIPYSHEKAKLE